MSLTFMQALAEMEAGKAVKRDIWTIVDGYRMILPGSKHVYMIVNAHAAPQVQWSPLSLEDLNASDWRLINANDVLENPVVVSETAVDPAA